MQPANSYSISWRWLAVVKRRIWCASTGTGFSDIKCWALGKTRLFASRLQRLKNIFNMKIRKFDWKYILKRKRVHKSLNAYLHCFNRSAYQTNIHLFDKTYIYATWEWHCYTYQFHRTLNAWHPAGRRRPRPARPPSNGAHRPEPPRPVHLSSAVQSPKNHRPPAAEPHTPLVQLPVGPGGGPPPASLALSLSIFFQLLPHRSCGSRADRAERRRRTLSCRHSSQHNHLPTDVRVIASFLLASDAHILCVVMWPDGTKHHFVMRCTNFTSTEHLNL